MRLKNDIKKKVCLTKRMKYKDIHYLTVMTKKCQVSDDSTFLEKLEDILDILQYMVFHFSSMYLTRVTNIQKFIDISIKKANELQSQIDTVKKESVINMKEADTMKAISEEITKFKGKIVMFHIDDFLEEKLGNDMLCWICEFL